MLTILCGLPGSGKSTYAANKGDATVVSTDELRKFLTGRYEDVSEDELVFDLARRMVDYYLGKGREVIFDATNVTRSRRREFLELARKHNQRARAVWFDVDRTVAKVRNRLRAKPVPNYVIDHLAARFQKPQLNEGFDEILIVRPGEQLVLTPEHH